MWTLTGRDQGYLCFGGGKRGYSFEDFKQGGEEVRNRMLFVSLAVVLALSVGLVGCAGQEAPGISEYNLTISSTEGGEVTNPGEGAFTYDEDDVVDLVAQLMRATSLSTGLVM